MISFGVILLELTIIFKPISLAVSSMFLQVNAGKDCPGDISGGILQDP